MNVLKTIRDELNISEEDLSFLQEYSQEQLELILDGFYTAREKHKEKLQKSIEKALGYIPFLLRGTVKAIVLSGTDL